MKKTKAEMFSCMIELFRGKSGRSEVPRRLILAWFNQVRYAVLLEDESAKDHPQGWQFNDGSSVIIRNIGQINGPMTVHLEQFQH